MPDTHGAHFLLGRTKSMSPSERASWYVSAHVRLGQSEGMWQTVDHRTIVNPRYLAVTFDVGPRIEGRDWDAAIDMAGGVQPHLRRIVARPSPGKMRANERDGHDVRHIIDILWREWHRNDMQAGCIHQGVRGDRSIDPAPCPETGYRWGSAWLVRPLDEHALARIAKLELPKLEVASA